MLCSHYFKEGIEGYATHEDSNATVLEKVLSYLYAIAYDDTAALGDTGVVETVMHVRFYILVDILDLQGLWELALPKFNWQIQDNFPPIDYVDGIQEAFKNIRLTDVALKKSILCSVWPTTPRLRNMDIAMTLGKYEPLS